MSVRPTRKNATARIIRPGETEPRDDEWSRYSTGERLAAVWELTKSCYAWTQEEAGELRLQRSVVHIQRARG